MYEMSYFQDYFVRDYQKRQGSKLLPAPAAMFRDVERERVQICRRVLKNAFSGYREGRKAETLKKLLGEYRKYVSGCHDERAKDIYNAFVYRYMVPAHVGFSAIGSKIGVTKASIYTYISRALDEMLMLCMGIPAMPKYPEEKEATVQMLIEGSRLFSDMAGDYVCCLFPRERERAAVEQGRQITRCVMGELAEAVKAYYGYCNDEHTSIDTDIRRAEILKRCLAGISPAAIAEEYGCCQGTVYADIRENERRLAAMLFGIEDKA